MQCPKQQSLPNIDDFLPSDIIFASILHLDDFHKEKENRRNESNIKHFLMDGLFFGEQEDADGDSIHPRKHVENELHNFLGLNKLELDYLLH